MKETENLLDTWRYNTKLWFSAILVTSIYKEELQTHIVNKLTEHFGLSAFIVDTTGSEYLRIRKFTHINWVHHLLLGEQKGDLRQLIELVEVVDYFSQRSDRTMYKALLDNFETDTQFRDAYAHAYTIRLLELNGYSVDLTKYANKQQLDGVVVINDETYMLECMRLHSLMDADIAAIVKTLEYCIGLTTRKTRFKEIIFSVKAAAYTESIAQVVKNKFKQTWSNYINEKLELPIAINGEEGGNIFNMTFEPNVADVYDHISFSHECGFKIKMYLSTHQGKVVTACRCEAHKKIEEQAVVDHVMTRIARKKRQHRNNKQYKRVFVFYHQIASDMVLPLFPNDSTRNRILQRIHSKWDQSESLDSIVLLHKNTLNNEYKVHLDIITKDSLIPETLNRLKIDNPYFIQYRKTP